jgi:hypothetical protein
MTCLVKEAEEKRRHPNFPLGKSRIYCSTIEVYTLGCIFCFCFSVLFCDMKDLKLTRWCSLNVKKKFYFTQ